MLQNFPHNSFVCSGIYYGEVLAPILILSVSYLNLLLLLLSYSHSVLSTVSKMILVDATAQIHNRFTSRFHCALILCLHYLQILRVRVMHCIPSAYFLHTLLRISISHAKGRLQKRRRKRSLSLHLSRVLYKVFIHHPFRFGV